MPLLQNNIGFFTAYFYTISTTILSNSKFQFVMEISKKKPFSYIRLELWVSEKKKTTAKRGSIIKHKSASAELEQGGPYGHRQGWDRCGCEALALHYRHLELCRCKEQCSLGSMRKNLKFSRGRSLFPRPPLPLVKCISSGKNEYLYSLEVDIYYIKQNNRQDVSSTLTRRSRES